MPLFATPLSARREAQIALALAAALPGAGHVFAGRPTRGLGFALFTLALGWLTWKVAPGQETFIGQHAAGAFVWALSVPDAYRTAYIRANRTKNAQ